MEKIISYIAIKIKYFYGSFVNPSVFKYCQFIVRFIEEKGLKRQKRVVFWSVIHVLLLTNSFLYIKIEQDLNRSRNVYIIKDQDLVITNIGSQVGIDREVVSGASTSVDNKAKGNYVASKNGTKYYLLSCSGVSRIKEGNKIFFQTVEEAKKRGLEPAKNCPGL